MARRLLVEAVLDTAAYARGTAKTVNLNRELDSSFKTLSVNAEASARAQVAAAVKSDQALRARVAGLRAIAASSPANSREQIAATNLANAAELRLARSHTVTAAEAQTLAVKTKGAERELGKLTRGALAGSGVFSRMGRSLAFASGAFLGISAISGGIRSAVEGAASLEKANRSLSVVLRRNNQDVGTTINRLDEWAKAQQDLGVSQTEALAGLQKTVVLTGSVSKGMLAYRMGLELSRSQNIGLSSALRISGKAIQGQTTSLTRYGIVLPKTTNAQKIFAAFQQRFGRQAEANTDAIDRLRAAFSNVTTEIGVALLPAFEHYATIASDWLAKTQNQKKLTDGVVNSFHAFASVVGGIATAVRGVDRVTGGFVHTLELLAAFKFASLVSGWVGALGNLTTAWEGVTAAATTAAAAETAAGAGAARGAAGAAGASRIILPAGVEAGGAALGARGAVGGLSRIGAVPAGLTAVFVAGDAGAETGNARNVIVQRPDGSLVQQVLSPSGKVFWQRRIMTVPGEPVVSPGLRDLGRGGSLAPSFLPRFPGTVPGTSRSGPQPFGGLRPRPVISQQFQLNSAELLAQAQAGLTRSNADDVRAAKQVVARIKRLIDQGRLRGSALVQALQTEASALSTIWGAEDAAAQKRAQAAAAAKARIQQQIENSIDPIRLEVALSRAQALGKPLVPFLKALRAAAQRALATGKLSLQQQKEAYDQIASLNQQIKDAATQSTVSFTLPPRLQLALARDAALGIDTRKDLLRARAAILRFIRTHKHNIQALTDAYNQLADINQQLGATTSAAFGNFKQASTRALTSGLGLTQAQRDELRARLSQRGPGGTTPGSGVGAAGFIIDPETGRPVRRRPRRPRAGSRAGAGGSADHPVVNATFDVNVYIGEHKIDTVVAKARQRHNRRNPTQRRGPNAATS